jgi:hypothetical protein
MARVKPPFCEEIQLCDPLRLDGTSRTFPPAPGFWTDPTLTYAEGSAASTAALGPPASRNRWMVERQWRGGLRVMSAVAVSHQRLSGLPGCAPELIAEGGA